METNNDTTKEEEFKEKDFLIYNGYNEHGKWAGLNVRVTKKNTIIFMIIFKGIKYILPISSNIYEKYDLIQKLTIFLDDKKEVFINCIKEKREHRSIKNYSVKLSFKDNNYFLEIYTDDNSYYNGSVYKFHIYNFDKLYMSIKEDMVFPGMINKNNGLRAIRLLEKTKDSKKRYWEAECLKCSRIIEIENIKLIEQKSCGCTGTFFFDSDEERFYAKVDKQENIPKELQIRGTLEMNEEPCWLWKAYLQNKGYGQFEINKKITLAHRYSWEIHNDEKLNNPKIYICHRCDNPSCVNPNHLFKGTPTDNTKDMINKGRQALAYGEKCGFSKLTEKQVLAIRGKIKKRGDIVKIATEYGLSRETVSDIVNRKTWRHL